MNNDVPETLAAARSRGVINNYIYIFFHYL